MQATINRETFVDRRQPILRWSAVIAGTLCSIGFWILLQLLGVGIGMTAADPDDIRSLYSAGVGTTTWSLISPLIAMFFGGLIAGRLARTYDSKLGVLHGLVMWAITEIVGLRVTVWVISAIAHGAVLSDRDRLDGLDGPASTADRLATIDDIGKALTIVGCSLLLSLITAALGAWVAVRRARAPGNDGPGRSVRTGEPGYATPSTSDTAVTTAPYGTPIAGPAAPLPRPDIGPR